jgi:hypothetical protein
MPYPISVGLVTAMRDDPLNGAVNAGLRDIWWCWRWRGDAAHLFWISRGIRKYVWKMGRKTILTTEEVAELQRLQSELEQAYRDGAAAMHANDGQRLRATEARQAAIAKRMREIQGTAGQPWMK